MTLTLRIGADTVATYLVIGLVIGFVVAPVYARHTTTWRPRPSWRSTYARTLRLGWPLAFAWPVTVWAICSEVVSDWRRNRR